MGDRENFFGASKQASKDFIEYLQFSEKSEPIQIYYRSLQDNIRPNISCQSEGENVYYHPFLVFDGLEFRGLWQTGGE